MEYLFWVWDPELTGEQNALMRTLEEGFMSANEYFVINSVMFLSQTVYLSSQGSHSPGKPGTLLKFCQPEKLLEFYVRPGIFGMISRFTLVLTF